ncbi:putative reverse transcriptase zinc-binding domain-containing protein [Helianthus debilis subsp. tardiflorus]
MAWRAELDRLPTRCALLRRNINVATDLCPLCGDFPETAEHLFVNCGFAQAVWHVVSQWCKIPPIYAFGIRDILEIHKYVTGSVKARKAIYAICLTSLWCVWKCRNEAVFNNTLWSLQKVIEEIKTLSLLWVKARARQQHLDWVVWGAFSLYKIGW